MSILEVKWELERGDGGQLSDPHYPLLLGSFYGIVKGDFPFHEPLPLSSFPDELTPATVKHRFRKAQNEWPLVQIGPGIMSVNITDDYGTFSRFKPLAIAAVNALYKAYPGDLKVISLILRYIDGVPFEYSTNSICEFLEEKMQVPIRVPKFITDDSNFEQPPKSLSLKATFRSLQPPGMVSLGISSGKKNGEPAVIWNQIFHAAENDVPDMPNGFESWIDASHGIIDKWFWKIIEGELERGFDNGKI